MENQRIAHLLRHIADVIEKGTDTEIDTLVETLGTIRRRKKDPEKVSNGSRSLQKVDEAELHRVIDEITNSESREAGSAALDRYRFTRNELVRLAKVRSVHVTKEDKVQQIKEKIIESTIGIRLRSLAVRGQ